MNIMNGTFSFPKLGTVNENMLKDMTKLLLPKTVLVWDTEIPVV